MILAADVFYKEGGGASVAGVVFSSWRDSTPLREFKVHVAEVAPYEPGAFFRRELPCLMALKAEVDRELALGFVVVDGYATLGPDHPGLGAHLHHEIGLPVIGVAKTAYRGAPAVQVLRGASRQPLFVTAAGVASEWAADRVREMAGPHRMPVLLRRVDQLSRA